MSGDSCPAGCSYSASGSLIRGKRGKPALDRVGCQVEWYVVNPTNPPDIYGLPNRVQTCEDQDPTCDLDSRPGHCSFEVVVCLNNDDPNLPACVPNGISSIEVLPPRTRLRTPEYQQVAADDNMLVSTALQRLLDPQNPNAGYTNAAPLAAAQRNFCSEPMTMNLEVFSGSARPREATVPALTFKVRSKDNRLPRPRKEVSRLRLICKARPLP
jgi:hypothetical protein